MNMSPIPVVSLQCINHNNYLIAAYHDALTLEPSTKPIKKNALWTVTYESSLWILINQDSSMRLTFNTETKLISSTDNNKVSFNKSVAVTDGRRRFVLRLSCDKIALELLTENDCDGKASGIFFVREGFHQIFHVIDPVTFFISTSTTNIKKLGDIDNTSYDYVVIGSSFSGLAFIHRILHNNPKAKIIVLEKGLLHLSEHYQHCCSSSSSHPREVEWTPWTISEETKQNEFIENVRGQIPLLGGRSTYWSGWSPTPSTKELAGWPEKLKTALEGTYFELARQFLGVTAANEIRAQKNNNPIYQTFQTYLKECLDSASTDIESIEQVLHAPLAMNNSRGIKFSTIEILLSMENVIVIPDCTVERISHDGQKATALQTSLGPILLRNDSKLILAMSTLPATTLVLNSFANIKSSQLSNVGKRFTAHFVSSVVVRVPRHSLPLADNAPDVELGAIYIAGIKDEAQYHVQLSGMVHTRCKDDSNIYDICKRYSANSIPRECIDISQDFAVVSCSTLGELDYKNKYNQFNLTDNYYYPTTNGELKLQLNEQDKRLWNWMDSVTFEVINKLLFNKNRNDLEYWHEIDKTWKKIVPPPELIRQKFLVHDASTMWIGDNEDIQAPVGLDYRLHGVHNVYITGGALWPTGGSWNPVLTIVAMAMHLADTIHESTCHIAES